MLMQSIPCPQCGRPLSVTDEALGKKVRCGKCKHVFRIEVPAQLEAGEDRQKADAPAEPDSRVRERPADREDRPRRKKKKKPRVYVEVRYPAWLGVLSFAWALVGWALAALAPHLAFVPLVGVLHYALPSVTVGLIGANLFFAVRNLWRGAHPLALLLVTGLQMGLFTTLFFQLFAHIGADLYDVHGPTSAWQWLGFSLAHALRAWDVLDVIEAFSLKVQMIRHDGWLVAVFVILYHIVVDVFFLGVVWDVVERIKEYYLDDDVIRDFVRKGLIAAFALWLIAWMVIALGVRRWSPVDIPLWFAENVLRVVDFADVMESFDLSLHGLPREGLTGALTFFCRLWIAIGIGLLLGKKKQAGERRIATPPEAGALAYWSARAGILAAGLLVVLGAGLLWQVVLADPLPRLTAASGDSEQQAGAALDALRRMGPTAEAAIPALAAARKTTSEATRDEITRTLGYLGTKAIDPLEEIALGEAEEAAGVAVGSLGQIRPDAAPALVKVWSATPSEAVRRQAATELARFGNGAVPPLMATTKAENAEAHYHWFGELDRNWRLRSTPNKMAMAIQQLPDLVQDLKRDRDAATTVKILDSVRECGSAAKAALPDVIDRLCAKDQTVMGAAAAVLYSIGPAATPELLRRLDLSGNNLDGPVFRILSDPRMWDEAALKDAAAIPVLTTLVSRPETPTVARKVAVRALGMAGPAAKGAVPGLLPLLGANDSANRALVREALGKIDPNWKGRPETSRAIISLLPRLPALPPKESDELLAVLGEVKASDGDALVAVLTAEVRPSDEKAYRNAVFGVLDRLGPKARAAVPALTQALADPKANFRARLRIVGSLKKITPEIGPLVPAVMRFFGTDDLGIDFLRDNYPVTRPYLEQILEDKDPKQRAFAVQAVNALQAENLLREEDKPRLLPRVIACLQDDVVGIRAKNKVRNSWEVVVEALNALDKDWVGNEAAVKVLAAMVANGNRDHGHYRERAIKLIIEAGPVARPLVPDLAKLLLAQDGSFDDTTRKALDRIDANWRKHPVIGEIVPELVRRLDKGAYYVADRALRYLGGAAVPELEKALNGARPDLRDRIVPILLAAGPASKEAVPTLLKEVVNPKLTWEQTKRVMASLAAIDPEWASQPRAKEVIPGVLAEVARQRDPAARYAIICAAIGPVAVPEALKLLGSEKAAERGIGLIALRDIGPAAKDALPAIIKLLKDKDAKIRLGAVDAVGRIGKRDKSLLLVLAPSLIDEDSYVQLAALGGMNGMDPDWKKSPQSKEVMALVLKNLSNSDPKRRFSTLGMLEHIGPAEGVVPALEEMVKREKDVRTLRQAEWLLNQRRQVPPR
jgi:predicted Zn finger-like uncharacterized protein